MTTAEELRRPRRGVRIASILGILIAVVGLVFVGPRTLDRFAAVPSDPSHAATTFDVKRATTCTKLLGSTETKRFATLGLKPAGANYARRVERESDGPMGEFARQHGMVCAWNAGGDALTLYAYAPMSAAARKAKISFLKKEGFERDAHARYVRYTSKNSYPGGWAFGHGYAAYALDNGAGEYLDEVVSNAPRF
jgi:hypothetical protein